MIILIWKCCLFLTSTYHRFLSQVLRSSTYFWTTMHPQIGICCDVKFYPRWTVGCANTTSFASSIFVSRPKFSTLWTTYVGNSIICFAHLRKAMRRVKERKRVFAGGGRRGGERRWEREMQTSARGARIIISISLRRPSPLLFVGRRRQKWPPYFLIVVVSSRYC